MHSSDDLRKLMRRSERWELPAQPSSVVSARPYCARLTGLSRLNHNILRLSCRAIAISCLILASASAPLQRPGAPVGLPRRSSRAHAKPASSEGGRESPFGVSPECTGRLSCGIVSQPLSLRDGETFELAPMRAGNMPMRGAPVHAEMRRFRRSLLLEAAGVRPNVGS